MALEGLFLQHDNMFRYNEEAYSNIYTEDEPHFYDLQASLGFLHSQTENYNSTFLQEDYNENTTTFLHQPLPELAISEANITANGISSGSPNCDMSYHRDREINRNKKATRRRTRVKKNKEEITNQRMTHIAVERNRRKLMNEYLSVLRSLMPDSYVQMCDQASIVGGSINFIRELEHRLHLLNATREKNENSLSCRDISSASATPFSDAFKLPQISMGSSAVSENVVLNNALADIEVSLVECHASLKIRSRRRPKILLHLVSGLQSLGFIILHLNVSTVSDFILYCFSTKMEDYCKLNSVADISTAVHEILRIHDGTGLAESMLV